MPPVLATKRASCQQRPVHDIAVHPLRVVPLDALLLWQAMFHLQLPFPPGLASASLVSRPAIARRQQLLGAMALLQQQLVDGAPHLCIKHQLGTGG